MNISFLTIVAFPFLFFSLVLSLQTPLQSSAHKCGLWISPVVTRWLLANPTAPGVQLAFHSPRCNIHCHASFLSKSLTHRNTPPLTPETPWRIASITKPFTALAILRLAERGQLNLDASVEKYLPSWAIEDLRTSQGAESASRITLRMLLHHTSGLPDHAEDWRFQLIVGLQLIVGASPHLRWTQKSVLSWAARHATPVGAPGERFSYSDTGYIYVGLVVENLTGRGLARAVRDLDRLDELDMPSTYWEILEPTPRDALPRARQYYSLVDVTDWDPSFDLFGGGGLVGNSDDLNRFVRAVHSGRLLGQPGMKDMYATVPNPRADGESYGCGWFNSSIAGVQAWSHTGFWGGWAYWVGELDLSFSGTVNLAVSPDELVEELVAGFMRHEACEPESEGLV